MADGDKKFPLILVIVLVVVGILLAGVVSYIVSTKVAGGANGANPPTQKVEKREPGEFVKIGDSKDGLVLNVGGPTSGHFIKINIIMEIKPDKNSSKGEGKSVNPEEIKILDSVVYTLRSMKVEDFDPAKQERLKETLKNEANKVLGEEKVLDVYITNFVLN